MVAKGFLAAVIFGVAAGVYTMMEFTAVHSPRAFDYAILAGVVVFCITWSIIVTVMLLVTLVDVYPKKLDRIADEIKYLNRRNEINDKEFANHG